MSAGVGAELLLGLKHFRRQFAHAAFRSPNAQVGSRKRDVLATLVFVIADVPGSVLTRYLA